MKTHKQTGFTLTRKPCKLNPQGGFTLIELLIVIAIISLLAAISIFALSGARKTGRDAARKADLETIRSALEFYKADCGLYPLTADFPAGGSTFVGPASCGGNTYVSVFPQDTAADRKYSYSSAGTKYVLCAALEGETTPEGACTASCEVAGSGVACSYKTTHP